MNFKHFCSALFISAAVVAVISCKEDEETETKPSLSGSLRFKGLPEYILSVERDENGDVVTGEGGNPQFKEYNVEPIGIHHPESKSIGYYWRQNPARLTSLNSHNDTCYLSTDKNDKDYMVLDPTGKKTLYFKDSLYTCTVTCGAFADGYYDSSVSTYTTIVKPGVNGSVTLADFGIDYASKDWEDKVTVADDEYVTIGDYSWTRRNSVPVTIGGRTYGIPFKNCEAMADVYGGYFTYDDVYDENNEIREGICPEGYGLPDDRAWEELGKILSGKDDVGIVSEIEGIAGKMMVDARFNADVENPSDTKREYVMWEYWPEVDITNSSALSVIPAGYANVYKDNDGKVESAIFKGAYKSSKDQLHRAVFLTADRSGNNAERVTVRYITENSATLHIGSYEKDSFAASVRCVKKIN